MIARYSLILKLSNSKLKPAIDLGPFEEETICYLLTTTCTRIQNKTEEILRITVTRYMKRVTHSLADFTVTKLDKLLSN
jgi:hypothetical protein